jgi:hypothetical protein
MVNREGAAVQRAFGVELPVIRALESIAPHGKLSSWAHKRGISTKALAASHKRVYIGGSGLDLRQSRPRRPDLGS